MIEFRVSELSRCPSLKTTVWVKPYTEAGKYIHDWIQEKLKEQYPEGKAEYEVSTIVEVDGQEVRLVGHVDYVRFDEPVFYEIKPEPRYTTKAPVEYYIQLGLYEWILRRETGREYVGYWVFYSKEKLKYRVMKPILHVGGNDIMVENLIRARLNKIDKIRGGLCRICELRTRCDARYRFTYMRGVEEI